MGFFDRDLTQGSISKGIWHLALPLMAANVLEGTFSLVDMMWVSRIQGIGKESIAAVALTEPIVFIVFTLIMGIGASTTAMVARHIGAGEQRNAEDVAFQALILGAVSSCAVALLGLIFSRRLFDVMGAEKQVTELAAGYLRIILAGAVVMFLLQLVSSILRGAGDAFTPMFILIISGVINVVLDPLLIFGIGFFPRLDVRGAALATVVARGIGCGIGFYFLFRGKVKIKLYLKDFRIKSGIMWKLLKIGMPSSAMMTMRSLMNFALMWIIAAFGTNAVAGYGVGTRIFGMILLPSFGLAMASMTLVGQNLGAGKPARAEKSSWLTAIYLSVIMGTASLIFFIFARNFISFFNSSRDVVSIGVSYLRITAPFYIAIAFGLTFSNAHIGAGDTVSPAVITFVSLWLLQVPLAYFISRPGILGINGVWWAMSAASLANGIMMMLWFNTGRWKEQKI